VLIGTVTDRIGRLHGSSLEHRVRDST
jgi:hypothetical protein